MLELSARHELVMCVRDGMGRLLMIIPSTQMIFLKHLCQMWKTTAETLTMRMEVPGVLPQTQISDGNIAISQSAKVINILYADLFYKTLFSVINILLWMIS
jgi:hypothetical protein